MSELLLSSLHTLNERNSVSTANNSGGTLLGTLHQLMKQVNTSRLEWLEFKGSLRAIPHNSFSSFDYLGIQFFCFLTTVQPYPSIVYPGLQIELLYL